MALSKLRFAFKREPDVAYTVPQFKRIESAISEYLLRDDYGSGVKEVYIVIVLIDPEHVKQFSSKSPIYRRGKYKIGGPGSYLTCENTLEFDVIPRLGAVRNAKTTEDLAALLGEALAVVYPLLRETEIPDFKMSRFVEDLKRALSKISAAGDTS